MPANLLLQRLSANRADLTPKARVIADYILNNPRKVIFMTTKELARAARVSEATVVRFVRLPSASGSKSWTRRAGSAWSSHCVRVCV